MLGLLEVKAHLRHKRDGIRYIYFPTASRDDFGESTMSHVLRTFFTGSTAAAIAATIEAEEEPSSQEELDRLARIIGRAREQGQ